MGGCILYKTREKLIFMREPVRMREPQSDPRLILFDRSPSPTAISVYIRYVCVRGHACVRGVVYDARRLIPDYAVVEDRDDERVVAVPHELSAYARVRVG